jgi:hypothetical protein
MRRAGVGAAVARALAWGLAPALVVGCGVGAQSTATVADPDDVPFDLLESTTTTVPPGAVGGSTVRICLDRGTEMVEVDHPVDTEPTDRVAAAVDIVLQGPNEDERAAGLATAWPAGDLIGSVAVVRGIAAVDLAVGFAELPGDGQLRAIAQMTCTLTAQRGVGQVRFTLDGSSIAVPRADGSVTGDPVTRQDYEVLIAPV